MQDMVQKYMKKLIVNKKYDGKKLNKFLLENKIYKENEILCLSFTNEATINLKNSILKKE